MVYCFFLLGGWHHCDVNSSDASAHQLLSVALNTLKPVFWTKSNTFSVLCSTVHGLLPILAAAKSFADDIRRPFRENDSDQTMEISDGIRRKGGVSSISRMPAYPMHLAFGRRLNPSMVTTRKDRIAVCNYCISSAKLVKRKITRDPLQPMVQIWSYESFWHSRLYMRLRSICMLGLVV